MAVELLTKDDWAPEFAIFVAALTGLLTAGPSNEWVSVRLTRTNSGITEPEIRSPAMVPYVLIMMLENFVVAFRYQHHWEGRLCNTPVVFHEPSAISTVGSAFVFWSFGSRTLQLIPR